MQLKTIVLILIGITAVKSQTEIVTISICQGENFTNCQDRVTVAGTCTTLAFAPRSARTLGSTVSCGLHTSSTCSDGGSAQRIGPSGHPSLPGNQIRVVCSVAPVLLTICPEQNFGGICDDRIIIPAAGCHSLAFAPRSARPSASNVYCTLHTSTTCSGGSFLNLSPSGNPNLTGVHIRASCSVL